MRYEVIERKGSHERVVATVRRENGAVNERDRQVEATYANAQRHAGRIGGRAVQGTDPRDPNAIVVALIEDDRVLYTTVTYRRLGPDPEVEAANEALEDALLASLVALNGVTL